MAYDPFAPVPDPTAVPTDITTTAIPLAANNALAAVAPTPAPNGNTGIVPPQMRGGHMPLDINAFMQAMQAWQDARPDRPTFDPTTGRPDDWRTQMDAFHTSMRDWAHSHPSPRDFMSGGMSASGGGAPPAVGSIPPTAMPPVPMPPVPAPVVPGAGMPPAPPGFANPGGVGMVPGVPGSVGLNPGGGGGPQRTGDWRSLMPTLPAMPSPGGMKLPRFGG
jgi:hypothetical protein